MSGDCDHRGYYGITAAVEHDCGAFRRWTCALCGTQLGSERKPLLGYVVRIVLAPGLAPFADWLLWHGVVDRLECVEDGWEISDLVEGATLDGIMELSRSLRSVVVRVHAEPCT